MMADTTPADDAPVLTREERLAKARDAFLYWAATATTDDVPAELPDPPVPPLAD